MVGANWTAVRSVIESAIRSEYEEVGGKRQSERQRGANKKSVKALVHQRPALTS
jgi:hypothetical protein